MDPREEEERKEEKEEEKRPSADTLLPTGSHDQAEQPTQGQEVNRVDEWDTDLETDDGTGQKHSFPPAERYLEACQQTGCVPVSSYLRQPGEANLNLNHYGVGRLRAKALATSLQSDNTVTNLELQDNVLKAEGTLCLMEMLQTNTSIKSLDLSDNQLHLEGAQIISKMLFDNLYITTIKLSGNHLDDSAAKYLVDALRIDYVLKELDLSYNNIYDAGGEHLGDMLASNTGIEVLNLSWNHLGMRTAVALAAALKVNSTLQKLRLAWNGFGPFETRSLGPALKHNSALALLDLSGNRLDDRAAPHLGEGLAANAALRVLELSHNRLTNIGALSLLQTVTENPSSAVEEMDVSVKCRSVYVCETFVELLEEARERRPGLDVRYSVTSRVTRNLAAMQTFRKFLEERNESIVDFFRSLDVKGTKKVSDRVFREAVKEANVPLDRHQLEWLIQKFDKKCTASIAYSQFAERP